jgi:hypothetical protein
MAMTNPSFIPQMSERDYEALRATREMGGPDGRLQSSWRGIEERFRLFGIADLRYQYGRKDDSGDARSRHFADFGSEVRTITIREQRFVELDQMIAAGVGESKLGRVRTQACCRVCGGAAAVRGLCRLHYDRWRRDAAMPVWAVRTRHGRIINIRAATEPDARLMEALERLGARIGD